jgi:hypothetical protein
VRPWLLLDVDGPLNPYRMSPRQATSRGYTLHRLTVDDTTRPVLLNRSHGAALLSLTEMLDLAWATTWGQHANQLISPLLGLPEHLPVIEWPTRSGVPKSSHRGCWKTPYIASWVGARPFAWVDSEVGRHDRAWLSRTRADGSYLLRRIAPNVGLVYDDFAAIQQWAAQVSRPT